MYAAPRPNKVSFTGKKRRRKRTKKTRIKQNITEENNDTEMLLIVACGIHNSSSGANDGNLRTLGLQEFLVWQVESIFSELGFHLNGPVEPASASTANDGNSDPVETFK